MNDDILNSLKAERSVASKSHIMVIGVGGAGGNAVNHMYELGIKDVDFMVCNTDQQALDVSPIELKVRMGEDGLGAGNDPAVGRRAAITSLDMIKQVFENFSTKMVFITAGMGGGTGTGATPVIAQMIHSLNIPVIAILTTPPINEGIHRFEQAMAGIRSMRELVDTFIIIKNETIIELSEERSVHDAFNMANDIVAYASKGIAEIALTQSDLVSVDISDVCKVVRHSRYAVMGMASESGENRVIRAIDQAVLSPLFGNVPIQGSKEVLVNFATSSPSELKMKEVNRALDHIQEIAAGRDANGDRIPVNIIWGTSIKPELGENIEIIIVVTGFHANNYYNELFGGRLEAEPQPIPEPQPVVIPAPQPAPQPIVVPQPAPQPTPAPAPVQQPTVAPQPKPQPVQPRVVPQPQPVQPVQPKPQPQPVQPKPQPVQPRPIPQPQPAQPVQPQQQEAILGNEPWRVSIPMRKEIATIPPQLLSANYKLDSKTPAYQTRRGMTLINEVKGKKIVIKVDGSKSTSEEVVDVSVQQSLDF